VNTMQPELFIFSGEHTLPPCQANSGGNHNL
jgi:hypothetical protein